MPTFSTTVLATLPGPAKLVYETRDAFRASALALANQVAAGCGYAMVVDLASTEEIDGAGVGGLRHVQRYANAIGIELYLTRVSDATLEVLRRMKLEHEFQFMS